MEKEFKDKQSDLEDISVDSTKSSISLNEPETYQELLMKVLSLLSFEKIPGVMAVRKGRVSILN